MTLSQKKYTEAEYQVIRDNAHMDIAVLAEKLNRSVKSVKTVRSKLGLTKDWAWTDEQKNLVRDNPGLSLQELSNLVGRPVSSCHRYRQIIKEAGEAAQGPPAPDGLFREPDAAYLPALRRIAMGLAEGDEAVAATLLAEMVNPSDDRPTVGRLCGRDAG